MSDTLLSIQDLTITYPTLKALSQVNLNIPSGVCCAIVGPNGAGKSTLLKAILGLEPIQSGSILLHNTPITKQVITNNIAFVPQSSQLNTHFPATVLDIVLMGRHHHIKHWRKKPSKADIDISKAALDTMGVLHLANRHITTLSGGQKQRVLLARAIAQDANIYFMDEPLAGVDLVSEQIIMDTLKTFQQQGKTVLVVHHDLHSVPKYFDHIVWLNQTIIDFGTVKDCFTKENYEQTFVQSTHLFKEVLS